MIRLLFEAAGILALWLLFVLACLALADRVEGARPLRADYQRCVTVHNGPLIRQRGFSIGTIRSDVA